MRFEETYEGWNAGRLTQFEAARILGMCERSFRRYLLRYEAEGLEGLIDRRLEQASHRRAPVDEVMALTEQYRTRHSGWNIKHFHGWYQRAGGSRSYTWVKKRLQEAALVSKAKKRGVYLCLSRRIMSWKELPPKPRHDPRCIVRSIKLESAHNESNLVKSKAVKAPGDFATPSNHISF